MKIHIPYISDQSIGGGYTFFRNFIKGVSFYNGDIEVVTEDSPYDILFAFSPTTISGEVIQRAKSKGAKFVLRMDGVPEDNRNSGKGTRRLVEYALQADYIIYQSEFIRNTVGRILKDNGVVSPSRVVYNGVDLDIFTPDGDKVNFQGSPKILHINYRKDNNKRYEEVLAMYREYWTYNKMANLILLGRYPTEWMDYNMGFFNGERVQRLGIQQDDQAKATFIRSCDFLFYPSYADPAPNVVLEAIACGVPVLYNPYGGTRELVGNFVTGFPINVVDDYNTLITKTMSKLEDLRAQCLERRKQFSIGNMMRGYIDVFDFVTL